MMILRLFRVVAFISQNDDDVDIIRLTIQNAKMLILDVNRIWSTIQKWKWEDDDVKLISLYSICSQMK